jgi:hypothetical protein
MTEIQRLVLDVLRPEEPEITDFTKQLAEIDGVEGVNTSMFEVDGKVRNLKITIEGDIDADYVREKLESISASVHSVDEVAAGEKLFEEGKTLQD